MHCHSGTVETTLSGFQGKSSDQCLKRPNSLVFIDNLEESVQSLEIRIKEDIKPSRKINVAKAA